MTDPMIAIANAAMDAKAELRGASAAMTATLRAEPGDRDRMAVAVRRDSDCFMRLILSEPFTMEGAAAMIEAVADNLRKTAGVQWTLDGQCAGYLGHPLAIDVLRRVKEGLDNLASQGSQAAPNHGH